jgi:16S rRNA (uracil1498-N3)-methyltransferase
MNRILIKESELNNGNTVVLNDYRAKHIISVLRPKVGDKLKVGILNGFQGIGVVNAISKYEVKLRCKFKYIYMPATGTSLLLALPRPKVLKRLIPQIVAQGVEEIILTNAEKIEKNYFATHWLKEENYNKLIMNGLEQSGDTLMPKIRIVKRLKPFIEDKLQQIYPKHHLLLAHPYTENKLSDICSGNKNLLAIGPEGGWSNFEIDMFEHAGFKPFSLGSRILRSDTAVIATLAIINLLKRT